MATGYDEDGTVDRLVCVGPPDGGGRGGSTDPMPPDGFVPNCFFNSAAGQLSATVSILNPWTIGTDDFALEAWIMPFGIGEDLAATYDLDNPHLGNQYASGGQFQFDNNIGGAGPYVRTHINGGNPPNPPLAAIQGASVLCPYGWTHYCANYDRDALCTFYMNGAIVDTVDISAFVADDMRNSALQPDVWPFNTAGTRCSFAIGPLAYHSGRLLTGAEILDSVRKKSIQIIGDTQAAYDWRTLRGHTGWEVDPAIIPTNRYSHGTAANRPIIIPWGVPMGAFPSVTVQDISGNGNHMIVYTQASYIGLTVGDPDGLAFGADLFFR